MPDFKAEKFYCQKGMIFVSFILHSTSKALILEEDEEGEVGWGK
jgi:hypothetical protein